MLNKLMSGKSKVKKFTLGLFLGIGLFTQAAEQAPVVSTFENGYPCYKMEENGKLSLDANFIYFTEKGMAIAGNERNPEYVYGLNARCNHFAIAKWKDDSRALNCAAVFHKVGKVVVEPVMKVNKDAEGVELQVSFGKQVKTLKLKSTGKEFQSQGKLIFKVNKPGLVEIRLAGVGNTGKDMGAIEAVNITGPAVKKAQAVMVRWRPAAAHSKIYCKKVKEPRFIVVSVEEVEGMSYHPVSTPFGYMNPGWISAWCFKARDVGKVPDPEKINYLLGVGPNEIHSSFNNEGGGVKSMPDGSYAAKVEQQMYKDALHSKYVCALKMDPIDAGTLFSNYFYNPDSKKWLYRGTVLIKGPFKPRNYITSFVEVMGGTTRYRTGGIRREVAYQAWFVDKEGKIFIADEYNVKSDSFIDNKGAVHVQIGGFQIATTPKIPKGKIILRPTEQQSQIPRFLENEVFSKLESYPIVYGNSTVAKVTKHSATVTLNLKKGFESGAKLFVAWDTKDGYTLGKDLKAVPEFKPLKWSNEADAGNISGPKHTYKLTGLKSKTKYYFRFRVENREAKIWDLKTYEFTTK